jgi:hypothetical protein
VQEKRIFEPHFTHIGILSRPLASFFGIVHLLAPSKVRFHSWKVAATDTICLYTLEVPKMGGIRCSSDFRDGEIPGKVFNDGPSGNLRISGLFLVVLKVAPKTLLMEGWNPGDVYDHKTARPR